MSASQSINPMLCFLVVAVDHYNHGNTDSDNTLVVVVHSMDSHNNIPVVAVVDTRVANPEVDHSDHHSDYRVHSSLVPVVVSLPRACLVVQMTNRTACLAASVLVHNRIGVDRHLAPGLRHFRRRSAWEFDVWCYTTTKKRSRGTQQQ